jgi:hypothetical protein
MRDRLVAVLILILLTCGSGCKKDTITQKPQTLEEGVAQLRTLLADANPEVQSNLYNGVSYGVRYGNYPQALESMDRILGDSSLNAQQKKAANDVVDLLKTAAQNQQNAPNPAQ